MLQKIKNIFHFLEAVAANIVYQFPSRKLTVIGVTGTDGKTTTATLIHHILTIAGYKAGILSTLSSAHTTTPGRFAVQKFLRRSVDNGCTHVVLEVTSIAIDQYRIWGTNFSIGVLTNIANNEHLDYHHTFENYKNIKLRFLATCQQKVIGPDLKKSDFKEILANSLLPGEFNDRNVMAAAQVARLLDINEATIIKAISSFQLPSGRLEIVSRRPLVIVDFAHTPQAFKAVLPVAKKMGKRLIHVFGATGNRDHSKRPIMAQIAARVDDYIFLTHEDTYNEDPKKIISEIEQGLIKDGYKTYEIVYDRKIAINKAIEMAKSGDVVILTGVGHQKSLNIGGHEISWSDQKAVYDALGK